MSVYSDIPNEFLVHPTSKELVLKNDELAVRQSLRNIINLEMSDKPFHPESVMNLRRILFENITPFLVATLRRNTINILNSLEPRAEIVDVDVGNIDDSGVVIVSIYYRVLNNQSVQTLSLYFDRVR